jgi:hypothetical protein
MPSCVRDRAFFIAEDLQGKEIKGRISAALFRRTPVGVIFPVGGG